MINNLHSETRIATFIKKTFLFVVIPAFVLWFVEVVLLPINYFTHRNWESLYVKSNIPHYGPFFPNRTVTSVEQGDLAFNTNQAVLKNVVWKTDALGFRNEKLEINPDITVVGDSFIVGTSMTQNDIFSEQLENQYNDSIRVYNLAPSTFSQWVELLETKAITKPKILIFSCIETTTPEVFDTLSTNYKTTKFRIKESFKQANLAPLIDRSTRFYIIRYLASRIKKNTGRGVASELQKDLFFLEGKTIKVIDDNQLNQTAAALESYKKYCDKIGVKFLFLPMPRKETVYFNLVPLPSQPDYMERLSNAASKREIHTINTANIYAQNRKESQLYYQKDDTHWNPEGVKLIAKAVKSELGDFLNF